MHEDLKRYTKTKTKAYSGNDARKYSCIVVAACNAASNVFTFGIVQAYENAEQKQNENNLKQERRQTMKKFISIWSVLAVLSAAVAIDFYIAINENNNPTGEQLLTACSVITLLVICSLIFIGAHIENICKNKED